MMCYVAHEAPRHKQERQDNHVTDTAVDACGATLLKLYLSAQKLVRRKTRLGRAQRRIAPPVLDA